MCTLFFVVYTDDYTLYTTTFNISWRSFHISTQSVSLSVVVAHSDMWMGHNQHLQFW